MKNNDLNYLHDVLVKMDDRLVDMHEVQIKQQASLDHHILRTDLLERELVPLRKHVYMAQGVGAFLLILSLIATIYAAVK